MVAPGHLGGIDVAAGHHGGGGGDGLGLQRLGLAQQALAQFGGGKHALLEHGLHVVGVEHHRHGVEVGQVPGLGHGPHQVGLRQDHRGRPGEGLGQGGDVAGGEARLVARHDVGHRHPHLQAGLQAGVAGGGRAGDQGLHQAGGDLHRRRGRVPVDQGHDLHVDVAGQAPVEVAGPELAAAHRLVDREGGGDDHAGPARRAPLGGGGADGPRGGVALAVGPGPGAHQAFDGTLPGDLGRPLGGGPAEAGGLAPVGHQPGQGRSEGDRIGLDHQAVHLVVHELGGPAGVGGGHHRHAAGHGLQGDEAQVLVERHERNGQRPGVVVAQLVVGEAAHEADAVVSRGQIAQAALLGALAGDEQGDVVGHVGHGLHDQVDALGAVEA